MSDTEESLTDEIIEEQAEVDAMGGQRSGEDGSYAVRSEAVALQNV